MAGQIASKYFICLSIVNVDSANRLHIAMALLPQIFWQIFLISGDRWGNTPTLLTPPTKEGETNIYKDPTQHTCVTKYQIQIPKAKNISTNTEFPTQIY